MPSHESALSPDQQTGRLEGGGTTYQNNILNIIFNIGDNLLVNIGANKH